MTDEGNELAFLYLDADDVVALYADIFNCTVVEAGGQVRSTASTAVTIPRPAQSTIDMMCQRRAYVAH